MTAAATAESGGCGVHRYCPTHALTRCAASGIKPHQRAVAPATSTTTGTKILLTRSPSRWMFARLVCARCTTAMMWARAVSSPTEVTRMVNRPFKFRVPA